MRKYKISLFVFQLLASTILVMAEAKTASFNFRKTSGQLKEERDLEIETNQETDVLPDLIAFTMQFHQ